MTDKELKQIDRETCEHFEWVEVWEWNDYVDDKACCKLKDAYINEPVHENEYFDYYIKCPCKTHYKEYKED